MLWFNEAKKLSDFNVPRVENEKADEVKLMSWLADSENKIYIDNHKASKKRAQ